MEHFYLFQSGKNGRVLLVQNEIVERFHLLRLNKWKGSINTNKNNGIVLFVPARRVEKFYYFNNDNWNSSIFSKRFKLELFY